MRKKSPPRQAPPPKTAPNAAKKAAEVQKARQTAARAARLAKQATQAAKETAQKVLAVVRAGLKALWAATQTLAAAIVAGGTTALLVIVVLCMVAMVAGSAFGIFFAAEPTGDGVSVAQAITELNEEYQERLQEIESEEEYDRQEIESTTAVMPSPGRMSWRSLPPAPAGPKMVRRWRIWMKKISNGCAPRFGI